VTAPALHIALAPDGPAIRRPAPPPVEALLLGRTPEEAAAMLPRLFNLCRAAQGLGARIALGLAARPEDIAALRQEILREHAIRLFVLWPRRLGLPAAPLPKPGDLRQAVFGPGQAPPDPAGLRAWMAAGAGVGRVFQAIADAFAPGEAVAHLPAPTAVSLGRAVAQENSLWARHPNAPLLDAVEAEWGRGPLWRALARLVDLDACLRGALDLEPRSQDGLTIVAAARGSYALSARVADGRVTAFARHTPTDHLLAPGGAFDQAFATLPAARQDRAPLLVDILDPCVPVDIVEAAHA
jgi:hypothetical protein